MTKTNSGEERKLLVVPHRLKKRVLHDYHDYELGGHRAEKPTLEILKRTFFWVGMPSDVRCTLKDAESAF